MAHPRENHSSRYPTEAQTPLLAVLLISFSLIAYEIILSRVLSVLLSYHYVFMVLSLALLGLGGGGFILHSYRLRRPLARSSFYLLSFVSSLFALSIPLSILLITGVSHLGSGAKALLLYSVILLVPFLLAGVVLAESYRTFSGQGGKIYGADLLGAALGCTGAIFLLDLTGGLRANFSLVLAPSIASLIFAWMDPAGNPKTMKVSTGILLIPLLFFVADLTGLYHLDMTPGVNPEKEIFDSLRGDRFQGKIIETRWSAFGRTDLVKYEKDPGHMDIYVDGTAGSPMYRFNGDLKDPDPTVLDLKDSFPGFLPLLDLSDEEKDSALVIGSGGGRDVLLTLMAGFRRITAVEINRDLVEMVQRHSTYNGGIYSPSGNLKIVVDEGRHFLKHQRERYDLIFLSLPVTNSSRSLEGYALTENFLFTRQSMEDYLTHLTEEGQVVVVTHNDAEVLRLLSIALAALSKEGIGQEAAMRHISLLGSDDYPVFILKRRPFKPEVSLKRYEALRKLDFRFESSYFPFLPASVSLHPGLVSLGNGTLRLDRFIAMVKERGFDIHPVSDNNPFFFKIERGIPDSISILLGISILFLLLTVLIPFLLGNRSSMDKTFRLEDQLRSMAFFALLGLGFMFIEISSIQRFSLFLGLPALSLSVLLLSLLGWAGVGGFWSQRISPDSIPKGIFLSSLSLGILILFNAFLLPSLFQRLIQFDLLSRILLTVLLLGPMGFLMGYPFSLGIRWLRERGLTEKIPWMWGINGVSCVLGSVANMVVAISFGFTEVFLMSAGCYWIASLLFLKGRRKTLSSPSEGR